MTSYTRSNAKDIKFNTILSHICQSTLEDIYAPS